MASASELDELKEQFRSQQQQILSLQQALQRLEASHRDEIRMFQSWGADVVGMTGLPEAVFAKEAGIRYAALGLVTNLAAGLDPLDGSVDHERHVDAMAVLIRLV